MTVSTTPRGIGFDLSGAMAAQRNLVTLSGALYQIEPKVLTFVQRRLPVEARRDILREYNISAGRVMKDLKVTPTNSGIRLTGFWRGIGKMQFGARQTREGVTYGVFKGQGRKLAKSAFIMGLKRGQVSKGNTHVVQRKTKARFPIEVLYDPTVAQMLAKGDRPQRLADYAVGLVGQEYTRLLALAAGQSAAAATT